MKKPLLTILLTLLLGTVALLGGKFWEKKKCTDWSEKEVIQLMTKSPWVHRVEFRVQNRMFSEGSGNGNRGAMVPDAEGRRERLRPVWGPGSVRSPYEKNSGGLEPQDVYGNTSGDPNRDLPHRKMGTGNGSRRDFGDDSFLLSLTVRWYALPIQHAIDRWTALRPQAKRGRKVGTGGFYIIGVSGLPPGIIPSDPHLLKSVRERLKSKSFLNIKGREPIPADVAAIPGKKSDVVDVRSEPWSTAMEIYLLFPRGQEGGHVITLADKKVEFVTQIGPLKVERKFKLKKMVYGGKLEL